MSFSPSAELPKFSSPPIPQVLSLTPFQTTKQPLPITLHAPSHHFHSQSFAHGLWICQDLLHHTITDTHPFLITSWTLSCRQGYSSVVQLQPSVLWPNKKFREREERTKWFGHYVGNSSVRRLSKYECLRTARGCRKLICLKHFCNATPTPRGRSPRVQ